jgi:hypothetical protein
LRLEFLFSYAGKGRAVLGCYSCKDMGERQPWHTQFSVGLKNVG